MKEKQFNVSKLCVSATLMIMTTLGFSGCTKADAEAVKKSKHVRPVKAIELQQSPQKRVMTFPGKAKAAKEVNIAFRVGGPLTELNVDDGMKVTKGSILARIDSRDFRLNVKTLEAKLAASNAQYEETTLQYERYKNLVKVNAASKSTYDQVKAGYEMAKALVDGDTRNLEAARNALADTVLYAPFTGYVHKILVENHETVNQGQPVVWLVDLSGVEVEIGIPESLIGSADDFKSYTCLFNAVSDVIFTAEHKEIGKKPNLSNSTYPLILTLNKDNANRVRPGMAADVMITVKSEKDYATFIVPASALVNKAANETFVWILNQNHESVEKRLVKAVQYSGNGVEVTGNIYVGEWLVTAGAHHLTQGQSVRLLKAVSKTNIGQIL